MPSFDIWSNFGFSNNPYSQETLPATDVGDRLLAGRSALIDEAQRLIGTRGTTPTFEGPIGAGKTSLLNVAIYRMYDACIRDKDKTLWLPAAETIQPNIDASVFEAEAYRIVLQTLIKHKDDFFRVGLPELNLGKLDTWLNTPEYESWSGGGGGFGFSAEAGHGHEPNTTDGFLKSGFPAAIRSVLAEGFRGGSGGVVLILDNLEIVGQISAARNQLDVLRDRVLSVPGVRWVLCGSRGTVSRARIQRLSGFFAAPEIISPLLENEVVDAVQRRIIEFGSSTSVAPLSPDAFRVLYRVLNRNLRDSMSWAQKFSHWLMTQHPEQDFPDEAQRMELLEAWLAEQAQRSLESAQAIQPRIWQFFDQLCENGGSVASSQLEDVYGFEHQQQGTNGITQLVNANLVVRESDPEDGTKTINAVTADGWMVFFSRSGFNIGRHV